MSYSQEQVRAFEQARQLRADEQARKKRRALVLLADGMPKAHIAKQLAVSADTVLAWSKEP